MKRRFLREALAWVATCAIVPFAHADSDLLISEYVEGSSNNKAIEIWNPTGAAVDLAAGGYMLQIYFNGAITPASTIALTGVLAHRDQYLVVHSSAAPVMVGIADLSTPSLNFNGNDAVVLVKGVDATVVDVIGQIGNDPGIEWGTGLQSTANHTLRRKPDVCAGDPNGTDVFDPAIEWDGYFIDFISGLNSHDGNYGCASVPVARSTWGAVKATYR